MRKTKIALILIALSFSLAQASASTPNITEVSIGNNSIVSDQIWINATVSDPDGYTIDRVSMRFNNTTSSNATKWIELNGTNERYHLYFNTSRLADGSYNLTYEAVADNDFGYRQISNITINNVIEPDKELTVYSPTSNSTLKGRIWVNASYNKDPGSNFNRTFVWKNSSGVQSSPREYNTSFNTSILSDGSYWISFNLSDAEGVFFRDNATNLTVNNTFYRKTTSPPSLRIFSPSEDSTFSGKIPVRAGVTDEDQVNSTVYRIRGARTSTEWRKFNETLQPGEIMPGTYNITFKSSDSDSNDSSTLKTVRNVTVRYEDSKIRQLCCTYVRNPVDDFVKSSRSSMQVGAVLKGQEIRTDSGLKFNLSGPVEDQSTDFQQVDILRTDNISPGRYVFQTENSSGMLDILPDASDAVGRIPQNPENIGLKYWINGSNVNQSLYNITTSDWYSGTLFQLNTSLKRYWISLSYGGGLNYHQASARAFYPNQNSFQSFVTDFHSRNSSIKVKVRNTQGMELANVPIKLNRILPGLQRRPYLSSPDQRIKRTDGNGSVYFGNLSPGIYRVESESENMSRVNLVELSGNYSSYTRLNEDSAEVKKITLTEETGKLQINMEGPSSLYSVLAEGIKSRYYAAGFKPVYNNQIRLPEGNYTVETFLFRGKNLEQSVDVRTTEVRIKSDSTTQISPNFVQDVTLEGRITVGGEPSENRKIVLINRTENLRYSAITGENGFYSVSVRNDTGYTVKAQAPGRRWVTETINSAETRNKNFSIPEKVSISGSIFSENIAEILLSKNGDILGSTSVGSGRFGFQGLNASSNYTLRLINDFGNTREKEISTQFSDMNINISGGGENYNLSVEINSSDGHEIPFSLSLTSLSSRFNNLSGIGSLKINNLSPGTYNLHIDIKEETYSDINTRIHLKSDRRLTFDLDPETSFQGVFRSARPPASLFLVSRTGFWKKVDIGSDGGFSTSISPGDYTVWTEGEGALKHVEIPSGGLEENFSISRSRHVSGRVSGLDDSGYAIAWNNTEQERFYSELENGFFNFTGLASYGYRLYVRTTRGSSLKTSIGPGNNSSYLKIDMRDQSRKNAYIGVFDSSGDPLEGATVSVADKKKVTGSSGRVKVQDIPEGLHTVRVWKKGFNTSLKMVNFSSREGSFLNPAKSSFNVEFVLGRDRTVNPVKIYLKEVNAPVQSASIVFKPEEKGLNTVSVLTGRSGEAYLRDLEPGNYTVTVNTDETYVKDFEYRGRSTDLDITSSLRLGVVDK
ncbi:MAG: hypothetical protein ABEK10_01995 [Candidatus Nanosalina sp.]